MSDLKKQLIKLGSINPELRPHIRKILAFADETISGKKNAAKSLYPGTSPSPRYGLPGGEWGKSWGKEPRELPKKGSAEGFYSQLEGIYSDDDLVDWVHKKGAIISHSEPNKFTVWTMGNDGKLFGSHIQKASLNYGPKWTGYSWLHFGEWTPDGDGWKRPSR